MPAYASKRDVLELTTLWHSCFYTGLLHSSIWSGITGNHNYHDEIDGQTSGHPHSTNPQQMKLNQREQNLLKKMDEIFQFGDGKDTKQIRAGLL